MKPLKPASRFRSILCGVDFSRQSAAALRHAAALAGARRARLTVAYVMDPLLPAAAAAAYDARGLAARALPELQRFLRTTLGPRKADAIRCTVVIGKPARGLLSTAERLRADLIVVGTHGLSGIRKVFFGSTAEAILRRSTLPVLAVPRKCHAPRRGWPDRAMVASVDLDGSAAAEASAAAGTAKSYGAALTLVHAMPDVRLPLWMRLDEPEINRSSVRLAQQWLDARLRTIWRQAPPETHVVVGDKADAIAAFAAARHADVLILPRPTSGSLGRFHQGGTAYRVLCSARCPVLVLPVARDPAGESRGTAAAPGAPRDEKRRQTVRRATPSAGIARVTRRARIARRAPDRRPRERTASQLRPLPL